MAATPRFKLNGKVYLYTDMQDLTLLDIITLERDLADEGLPLTWTQILEAVERIAAAANTADVVELTRDPLLVLCRSITIWVSMRAAGDDVTIKDVLSQRWDAAQDLPLVQDKLPKAATPDPTKARASARAGNKRKGKAASTSAARTSESPSTDG